MKQSTGTALRTILILLGAFVFVRAASAECPPDPGDDRTIAVPAGESATVCWAPPQSEAGPISVDGYRIYEVASGTLLADVPAPPWTMTCPTDDNPTGLLVVTYYNSSGESAQAEYSSYIHCGVDADMDGSGSVNSHDFSLWLEAFESEEYNAQADFDWSGTVNANDFDNFFKPIYEGKWRQF